MQNSESRENYLETVLILQKKLDKVRSVDVAHHLNFSKPSVSRAMSLLRKDGLIVMDRSGQIALTEKGRTKAERILNRHKRLSSFLVYLGVSKDAAEEDACRIEHVISPETMDRISDFLDKQALSRGKDTLN